MTGDVMDIDGILRCAVEDFIGDLRAGREASFEQSLIGALQLYLNLCPTCLTSCDEQGRCLKCTSPAAPSDKRWIEKLLDGPAEK